MSENANSFTLIEDIPSQTLVRSPYLTLTFFLIGFRFHTILQEASVVMLGSIDDPLFCWWNTWELFSWGICTHSL